MSGCCGIPKAVINYLYYSSHNDDRQYEKLVEGHLSKGNLKDAAASAAKVQSYLLFRSLQLGIAGEANRLASHVSSKRCYCLPPSVAVFTRSSLSDTAALSIAKASLVRKDVLGAIEAADGVVRKDEELDQTYRAISALQKGTEALLTLSKIQNKSQLDYRKMARLQMATDQFSEALETILLIQAVETRDHLYRRLAEIYASRRDFEGVMEILKMISRDADFDLSDILEKMAYARIDEGNFSQAEKLIKKIGAGTYRAQRIYEAIARALISRNEIDEAFIFAKKLAPGSHEFLEIYREIAEALASLGRAEEALEVAETLALNSVSLSAGNRTSIFQSIYKKIAQARIAAGDIEGALLVAAKMVPEDYWTQRVYEDIIRLQLARKDLAAAFSTAEKLIPGQSDRFVDVCFEIIDAQVGKENLIDAFAVAGRMPPKDPRTHLSYEKIAHKQLLKGDIQGAYTTAQEHLQGSDSLGRVEASIKKLTDKVLYSIS